MSWELQAKFVAMDADASMRKYPEEYCTCTGIGDKSRSIHPHVIALGIQDYDNNLVSGSFIDVMF